MIILHFRLQSQFKYELVHIYFTTESFTMSDQLFGVQILSNRIKHVETFVFDRKTFFSPNTAEGLNWLSWGILNYFGQAQSYL